MRLTDFSRIIPSSIFLDFWPASSLALIDIYLPWVSRFPRWQFTSTRLTVLTSSSITIHIKYMVFLCIFSKDNIPSHRCILATIRKNVQFLFDIESSHVGIKAAKLSNLTLASLVTLKMPGCSGHPCTVVRKTGSRSTGHMGLPATAIKCGSDQVMWIHLAGIYWVHF